MRSFGKFHVLSAMQGERRARSWEVYYAKARQKHKQQRNFRQLCIILLLKALLMPGECEINFSGFELIRCA